MNSQSMLVCPKTFSTNCPAGEAINCWPRCDAVSLISSSTPGTNEVPWEARARPTNPGNVLLYGGLPRKMACENGETCCFKGNVGGKPSFADSNFMVSSRSSPMLW